MNRRSVLAAAGILTLSQFLSSCGGRRATTLKLEFLSGSVPSQLLQSFRRTLNSASAFQFTAKKHLAELFQLLEQWQSSEAARSPDQHQAPKQDASPDGSQKEPPDPASGQNQNGNLFSRQRRDPRADWVTLGDVWLTAAIRQQLIQPLDAAPINIRETEGWTQLPRPWQALVTRDRQGLPSADGQIWGAPYRWGHLVIAYRKQRFNNLGWVPTDWSDLWRDPVQRRLSLPDQPRLVMGLILKSLGQSINTSEPDTIPDLKNQLRALHRQVRFYSSDTYLQPLLTGDTWLAVGWSTDVLPLLRRNRTLAAVVPQSGTVLSADVWVRPAGIEPQGDARNQLRRRWLDFCWQRNNALQLSLSSQGASPIVAGLERHSLPAALQDDGVLLPTADILDRSEFLAPLSDVSEAQYQTLWREVRQG